MMNKKIDYQFLIMDYLKSYRLYHSYQETISIMKKIINKEHIPILTKDLKNIDKQILSDELSKIVLSQINSNIENKQDLTELIPDIMKNKRKEKKTKRFILKKTTLLGTITTIGVATAIGGLPSRKNDGCNDKTVQAITTLKINTEKIPTSEKLVVKRNVPKPSVKIKEKFEQKEKKEQEKRKQILSNFKKCKSIDDILKRKKQLKSLNLGEKDKIYKNCKLSAPLQRFMYEQSIIHEIPVDFIFSIIYTETRGDFDSNGEKSYNAPGNYDLGLTQQNTKSSVKSFAEKYKINFEDAANLILNDPYVNVVSFFLELEEIKTHLNNKFDRRNFAGHYNGWCNWEENDISKKYLEINDKAYNKIYTKYHKVIKK